MTRRKRERDSVRGVQPCNPGPTVSASRTDTRVGWTAGGGWEWMFAPRWSFKAEYLYYDLGHRTLNTAIAQTLVPALPFFGGTIQSTVWYDGFIARGGLNFHF
jgi:outer membrane immunogenic protein